MKLERYNLIKTYDDFKYEFESIGPKGTIRKIIEFQRVKGMSNNFYNVILGDLLEATGTADTLSVSNNQDRAKVLATVAIIMRDFMQLRPRAIILVAGSTAARTRLYQMSISFFWEEISREYYVYGKLKKEWIDFRRNVNFEGFLVFKKNE